LILIPFDYVDGQPLPISEIEKDLPGHSAELLLESKWTFITQDVSNLFQSFSFSLNDCFNYFLFTYKFK